MKAETGMIEREPQMLWLVMYEDLTQDCDGTYPVGPFWVLAGNEDDADNAAGVLLGQMPDRPAEVGTLEIRPATAEEAARFRLVEDEVCRGCGHVESLHVADGPVLERACAAEGCACEALGWHFPPIPDQSELIAELARVAKALGEPGFEAHVDEAVRLFARAARRIEVAEAAVAPHDLRRWAAVIRANAAALGRAAALQVELAAARVAPVTAASAYQQGWRDGLLTMAENISGRYTLMDAGGEAWTQYRSLLRRDAEIGPDRNPFDEAVAPVTPTARESAPAPSPGAVAALARARADRDAERERVKTVRKRRRLVGNSGLASRLDPAAAASLAKLAHPDAENGGAR